jgi:hypothetical protein
MSEPPTRRRWFQFGLGPMLLLVTVVAAFLAYHVNWIRQRRDFLKLNNATALEHDFTREDPELWEPVSAPGLLWLFGEEGQCGLRIVIMDEAANADDRDKAQRLFPEAIIKPVPPQFWPSAP